MGSNSHGFKNEESISSALHNKLYKDIEYLNLKTFIKEIHPSIQNYTLVKSPYKEGNKFKKDVEIIIEDKSYYISVKMGSGNSIHQEKVEPFIHMLEKEYGISNALTNYIRKFIWGDGTIDGSGRVSDRCGNSKLKTTMPVEIRGIQNFINSHKEELLRRFLINGSNKGRVDYIYYGTPKSGVWCPADNAIEFQLSSERKSVAALYLGDITFQAWNRCLSGNNDYKRGQIQLKWGRIEPDIKSIRLNSAEFNMGTHEGNSEEFNFTRELNKNKSTSNEYWKLLINTLNLQDSIDNYYAVKVSTKVLSKLNGKKVFPKADTYLVKASIDKSILLENNYIIDEDIIANIEHKKVPGSGISIKRINSKKFTILKMNLNSFYKIFSNYYWGAGASLFCSPNEFYKNDQLVNGWNATYEQLITNLDDIDDISLLAESTSTYDVKSELCKRIKFYCNNKIKETIINDPSLIEFVFKGTGIYEEPYVANFIFKNNKLSLNKPTDFTVTTGSGRSKGKYSIILKPKE